MLIDLNQQCNRFSIDFDELELYYIRVTVCNNEKYVRSCGCYDIGKEHRIYTSCCCVYRIMKEWHSPLVRNVKQVGVHRVRRLAALGCGHGDVVLLCILDEFRTGQKVPLPPGGNDLDVRLAGVVSARRSRQCVSGKSPAKSRETAGVP